MEVAENQGQVAAGERSGVHDASASDNDDNDDDDEVQRNARTVASLDTKIDIRLINRRLSGADLLNLIIECPYHSPASLSAMSLAAWNHQLVEPASVVSAATVTGKTNLVTAGIIFTSTGSRISQSGNAYCSLRIGTLRSGPCLTVLMFGQTLSSCRDCRPGKVVLLSSPRLLPAKEGPVSLSVSDGQQFIILGDARDYGRCQAKVRGKNEQGQWTDNAKGCKNHVDKRISEFCEQHRGKAAAKKTTGKMQQLRAETLRPAPSLRAIAAPRAPVSSSSQRMAALQQMLGPSRSIVRAPANKPTQKPLPPRADAKLAHNRLLHPLPSSATRSLTANVPQALRSRGVAARPVPMAQSIASVTASRSRPTVTPTAQNKPPDNWLHPASSRSKSKRRSINTQMSGFDGSVPVPQSKLAVLPRRAPVLTKSLPRPTCMDQAKARAKILSQQQAVKEKLQQSSGAPRPRQAEVKLESTWQGPIDVEEVATTKSMFAHEAEAEEYARSRSVVEGLEEEEHKKLKAKNKEALPTGSIQREWVCKTCGRTTKIKPTSCFNANHLVKMKRQLQETKTADEQRLELSNKRAEDGGLKLGSGLEWERWSRFS